MPTNSERRAAAKRNLDQQVQQRAEAARKQRRSLMIVGAVAAVLLIAGVVFVVLRDNDPGNVNASGSSASNTSESADSSDASGAPAASAGQLPKFTASPQLGADCQYPKARPATKAVEPPRSGKVPTDPAEVSVSMMTDQGPIGLMLNNGQSPCTVNSFISLAAKDFSPAPSATG